MLDVQPTFTADIAALLDSLLERRCTPEVCAELEQAAANLSPEEARETIARLPASSTESALWLLGCLQMRLQDFRDAAEWRQLWWAVEGDGRAPILLSSAKALLRDSRPEEEVAVLLKDRQRRVPQEQPILLSMLENDAFYL